MLNKFLISFFTCIAFTLNLYANEKQLIVKQITDINNITFDFIQETNNKKEIGTCVLVFDNKLKCNYKDSQHKEIILNKKKLVVLHKRYDKIYFFPLSHFPFTKIFNKKNLINLITNSSYQLNDNIELTYIGKNKEKIILLFKKNTFDLAGWKVIDKLQNVINFSIKIRHVNSEINPKIFKIPVVN